MNKKIIIELIKNDMKYHNHMYMIYQRNEVPSLYYIDILSIVTKLMGFEKNDTPDEVIYTYMEAINESVSFSLVERNELAEKCHNKLMDLIINFNSNSINK